MGRSDRQLTANVAAGLPCVDDLPQSLAVVLFCVGVIKIRAKYAFDFLGD